jgi:hypothetical protein
LRSALFRLVQKSLLVYALWVVGSLLGVSEISLCLVSALPVKIVLLLYVLQLLVFVRFMTSLEANGSFDLKKM